MRNEPLPEKAVVIIGAGNFGRRAAKLLTRETPHPIFIVDRDADRLAGLKGLQLERILSEGVRFLKDSAPIFLPRNVIVPAVPFHLAFEWLEANLPDGIILRRIPVPEAIKEVVPHTWDGPGKTLLVSFADFRCPENCPEPAGFCTETGEKRDIPLFSLLRQMKIGDYGNHIIQSRQLAPGLGGYRHEDLTCLLTEVIETGSKRWLLGTSCKCHGTISAFEIRKKS